MGRECDSLGERDTMTKIAFVFPGQGAQSVGMGRDLYANSAAARTAFETVDAACGFGVSALCFDGPEDTLKQTRNTQPALFATSVAALAACREAGLMPDAVAGHSVGEYAALVAAGALTIAEGARLVAARGAAMETAAQMTPGAMAAVLGLEPTVIAEACAEVNPVGVVTVANLNAPGQTVISGEATAVEAVTPLLKARGAKRVVVLAVSGAFHSPLMSPATDVLRPLLEVAPYRRPDFADCRQCHRRLRSDRRRDTAKSCRASGGRSALDRNDSAACQRWLYDLYRMRGRNRAGGTHQAYCAGRHDLFGGRYGLPPSGAGSVGGGIRWHSQQTCLWKGVWR